jgi:hypothetical protein
MRIVDPSSDEYFAQADPNSPAPMTQTSNIESIANKKLKVKQKGLTKS